MPDNEEEWSFVGSEKPCACSCCGKVRLTSVDFCWKHLPEDQKTGFKDKIEGLATERNGDLQNFILQEAKLCLVDLHKSMITGACFQGSDLSGANLQGVDLTEAKLQGANLSRVSLQEAYMPAIEYDAETSFIGTDIRNVDWSKNPSLERYIKDQQWLHDFKQRAKRSRKLKIWEYIWRETCDYGKSISRWIVCSVCLAVYFGILYDLLPVINYEGSANTLLTPYYYSVVTFTTLGFGDVIPKNAYGEFAVTLEVMLGYIMLGGLISIFSNKLARRS